MLGGMQALLAVALALTATGLLPQDAPDPVESPKVERPNIVFVFVDDQGYYDLGCYGATEVETPHIDRMASEGTRFTDYYAAAPICSPSRAGLLTGCYPRRVGNHVWVHRADSPLGLHPDELTIADYFGASTVTRDDRGRFTIEPGALQHDRLITVQRAIEDGVVPGPRFVAGGRGLDTVGGYQDTESWWWELGNKGAGRFCNGPTEFQHAVRDEVSRGVEMIKIFPSGGHGVNEELEALSFTREELEAVVQTAHHRGARVRAHCRSYSSSIRWKMWTPRSSR